MKYLEEDLEAIAKGLTDISDVAKQYGVSKDTLRRCLNRRGYHLRKIKIRIIAPYNRKVVGSIQECAETLKLSRSAISNALKGKSVQVLDELGIKLEVVQ